MIPGGTQPAPPIKKKEKKGKLGFISLPLQLSTCCLKRYFTQFNFVISNWTHKSCSVVLLYSFFCDFYLWNQAGHTSGHLELNQYNICLFAWASVDKVVIVALSPVHAEDMPQDIHNKQNPQKLGIQSSLGTSAVWVGQTKPLFDLKDPLLDISHVMPSQMVRHVTEAAFMARC